MMIILNRYVVLLTQMAAQFLLVKMIQEKLFTSKSTQDWQKIFQIKFEIRWE